jgi:uncharacterized membrane protein
MAITERDIKMAAKLYKCRDTAKSFYKDEYHEKLRTYKNVIEAHMNKFNIDVLPSVFEICSFESVRDNGMATMLFMAAAVELVEPSGSAKV